MREKSHCINTYTCTHCNQLLLYLLVPVLNYFFPILLHLGTLHTGALLMLLLLPLHYLTLLLLLFMQVFFFFHFFFSCLFVRSEVQHWGFFSHKTSHRVRDRVGQPCLVAIDPKLPMLFSNQSSYVALSPSGRL